MEGNIARNLMRLPQLMSVFGNSMAISHEVSGEIASALFAAKERSPEELDELKKIVFQIYSTLEQSAVEGRTTKQPSAAAATAAAIPSSKSSESI